MTGPEHYREAERLTSVGDLGHVGPGSQPEATNIALAQVHATLALAAATASNDAVTGMGPSDHRAWARVAGCRGERE